MGLLKSDSEALVQVLQTSFMGKLLLKALF
jgi:hypothetical protein